MVAKYGGHSVDTVLVKGPSPKIRIIPLVSWPPYSTTLRILRRLSLVAVLAQKIAPPSNIRFALYPAFPENSGHEWERPHFAAGKGPGENPQLVLPHPDFVPTMLEMNFVHQLADQVNAASVVGIKVLTPLGIR